MSFASDGSSKRKSILGRAGAGVMGGSGKDSQLWKTFDTKANKNGPHHTVFWVTRNNQFDENKKLGLDTAGKSQYKSGNKYSGDWVDNKKHGFGVLTKSSGEKYEGYWRENRRHGTGTLWERRKGKLIKRYTGNWSNNVKNGAGVYYYDNGDKYEGEWRSGKKHGRGTMEYADGTIYEGDWEDDKRCGIGVLLLQNGDRFEGSFYADVKEGPGRFFYIATKKLYEGEWANDTAKCGVYRDLPPEFQGDHPEPAAYQIGLPGLKLVDPEWVMDQAVTRVESKRDLPENASPEQAFTQQQIAQLQQLFAELDQSGEGYLDYGSLQMALRRLGLDAPVAELQEFLSGLDLYDGCAVSLEGFFEVVTMMKAE